MTRLSFLFLIILMAANEARSEPCELVSKLNKQLNCSDIITPFPQTPTPTPIVSGALPIDLRRCKKTITNPFDGPGGFTYKQSDVHPGMAALLPSPEKGSTWLKLSYNGVTIDFDYIADFTDGRPIYRSETPQYEMKDKPYAVLRSEEGVCRVLAKPWERVD